MQNNFNKLAWFEYFIMFLLIFITLYYGFGTYALENMNEGLYGEIPREMIQTGNYLIPHLNYVPYLEKPPMLYWLIALSYHIFGVTGFAARLIPVTAGALTCLVVFWFGKSLNLIRQGWVGAIVLASSMGFILISRVIIFDMVLTLFFVLALCFFYLWYEQNNRRYLWLCYAFIGLAFLTKGLLAVVLIPVIALLFMLIAKTDWKKIVKTVDIIGIFIFLLVILPWAIAASIKQPHFAYDFFINEQFMRFLNKRIPHDYHTGPFYYYIIPLLVIMLPWTLFLPFLFKKVKKNVNQAINRLKIFLAIWFAIPFAFFSISQAKAQYYIIIGIPALALLIAIKLCEFIELGREKIILRIFYFSLLFFAVLFLIASLILFYPYRFHFLADTLSDFYDYALPLLIFFLTALIYLMAGWILNFYFGRKYPFLAILLIASTAIPLVIGFVWDKQRLQPQRSEVLLASYILKHDPERPVYLYQNYEQISSILYYLKKRLPIIDSQSQDLYFGSHTPEAKDWFITTDEFKSQVENKHVYVVIENKKIAQFKSEVQGSHFCIVSQSGDVSVLSNKKDEC